MLVIPSEARNLKISQLLCSFEMTNFFCRSLYFYNFIYFFLLFNLCDLSVLCGEVNCYR